MRPCIAPDRIKPVRTLFLVNGGIWAAILLALFWRGHPFLNTVPVTILPSEDAALRQSKVMIQAIDPEVAPTVALTAYDPALFGSGKRSEPFVAVTGDNLAGEHVFSLLWNSSGNGIVEVSYHRPSHRISTRRPVARGDADVLYWLRRTGVLGVSPRPPHVVLLREVENTITYRAHWDKNTVQVSLERDSGSLLHLWVLKSNALGIRPVPVAFLEDRPPVGALR